ncbi:MAG: hypothetical protein LBK58_08005 [Prevotellaceae bacterium]|jgi:hypothetical protein|nr:hypothetical protein [Prevotellaceae bacterium]
MRNKQDITDYKKLWIASYLIMTLFVSSTLIGFSGLLFYGRFMKTAIAFLAKQGGFMKTYMQVLAKSAGNTFPEKKIKPERRILAKG